jgi:hypothetical protein
MAGNIFIDLVPTNDKTVKFAKIYNLYDANEAAKINGDYEIL